MRGSELGQALLEFALVAPMLFLMELGVIATVVYGIAFFQVEHAATEGAIAGATATQTDRCAQAESIALDVLGHSADVTCTLTTQELSLTVHRDIPAAWLIVSDHLDMSSTMRAEIR